MPTIIKVGHYCALAFYQIRNNQIRNDQIGNNKALTRGPLVDVLSVNDLRGIRWGDTRLMPPPLAPSTASEPLILNKRDAPPDNAGESAAVHRALAAARSSCRAWT